MIKLLALYILVLVLFIVMLCALAICGVVYEMIRESNHRRKIEMLKAEHRHAEL
jgi:hypothetical protein